MTKTKAFLLKLIGRIKKIMRTSFWTGFGAIAIALAIFFFEILKPQDYLLAKVMLFIGLGSFILAGINLEVDARREKRDRQKLFDKLDEIRKDLNKNR
jgi:formate-dependent nitrite reductase membrane component NrfD